MHSSQWTQGGADPKSFCNTILEQTLTDPDKYQIGLTKVFLRAGMLAYLESRRLDRLNSLATIIQKNFKRTMERNRYLRLRKSTIKIQTWWRGITAKRLVLAIRKEVAARRLQAVARRFVQRRKFLEVHNTVINLQARKFEFASRCWTHPRSRDPRCFCTQDIPLQSNPERRYQAAILASWSVRIHCCYRMAR